jgi:hypothetical protein
MLTRSVIQKVMQREYNVHGRVDESFGYGPLKDTYWRNRRDFGQEPEEGDLEREAEK